jgi:hypothetical protein
MIFICFKTSSVSSLNEMLILAISLAHLIYEVPADSKSYFLVLIFLGSTSFLYCRFDKGP